MDRRLCAQHDGAPRVYPGFDEVDSVGPLEVLVNATYGAADWTVSVVSTDPGRPVTGLHGMRILPDDPVAEELDLLVVPGGGWTGGDETIGVRAELKKGVLPERIRELHAGGTTVAGVCTGGLLLGCHRVVA